MKKVRKKKLIQPPGIPNFSFFAFSFANLNIFYCRFFFKSAVEFRIYCNFFEKNWFISIGVTIFVLIDALFLLSPPSPTAGQCLPIPPFFSIRSSRFHAKKQGTYLLLSKSSCFASTIRCPFPRRRFLSSLCCLYLLNEEEVFYCEQRKVQYIFSF